MKRAALNFEGPGPSEKQKRFLTDTHRYIAYGGARGGGKSWAIRVKAVLLCVTYPGIRVMIVRHTYPELEANHIGPLRAVLPREAAIYNAARREHRFLNGSLLMYRYCGGEADMARYQGTEADVVCIDEATQFSERVFRMFDACVRGVNGYPKRIYLTCNPGGEGHAWVKRLFIDRCFAPGEDPADYAFIPATVQDNAALLTTQPGYIRQLKALPDKLRSAWLEGNWDVLEGQFFEEFRNSPNPERRFTHVIEPFTPPRRWRRYRSFDFGYSKPFSVGWWVQDDDGRLYRILELYGCTGTPDEGVRWTTDRIFSEIWRIEEEHPYLKGHSIEGVADPAIWEQSRGPSIAEMAARQGIYFRKGDHKRLPGWMQVHYRLRFDEEGIPMLYVFSTCRAFIRTIPNLTYSETCPEDLETHEEDHVADEVRYMCMLDPIPPSRVWDSGAGGRMPALMP